MRTTEQWQAMLAAHESQIAAQRMAAAGIVGIVESLLNNDRINAPQSMQDNLRNLLAEYTVHGKAAAGALKTTEQAA